MVILMPDLRGKKYNFGFSRLLSANMDPLPPNTVQPRALPSLHATVPQSKTAGLVNVSAILFMLNC